MRRKFLNYLLIFVFALVPVLAKTTQVKAAGISGGEIIAMVNNIRTGSFGLSALIEDSILDATAQWTAEEMAATGNCIHLSSQGYAGASQRVMAAGYGGGKSVFVTENMACAREGWADIGWLQGVWADAAHMLPMSDGQYVRVGVGVYTSGGMTYYVLHAASYPGSGSSSVVATSASSASTVEATIDWSNWVTPIITSTPNGDGSIYHVIQYGQALASIAEYYGVTVDQIKTLNGLTSNDIYVGNSLLIRLAPTVTITPTRTSTVRIPTRTPTQTAVPPTPKPTQTITPTPKFSLGASLPKIDRQWLGLGLVVLSAVGFFIVLYSSFLKSLRKK